MHAGQDVAAILQEDLDREDMEILSKAPVKPTQLPQGPPMPLLSDCGLCSSTVKHVKCLNAAVECNIAAHTDTEFAWSAVHANTIIKSYVSPANPTVGEEV